MEQIYNQTSYAMPPSKRGSNTKDILTIIFLVLMPIVGLVLIWTISSWGKKAKVVVTLVLGLPIIIAIIMTLFSIGLVSKNSAKDNAKDIRAMADMNMMQSAAEIYYTENGSYLNLSSDLDVSNLQKQIQGESGKWPGIVASDNSYCADATLSDGRKYCIDSAGKRGENIICSNTQLICISH